VSAFPKQAVAFEVHEMFRSAEIPRRLMNEFQHPVPIIGSGGKPGLTRSGGGAG
jgi:hypothetical protein